MIQKYQQSISYITGAADRPRWQIIIMAKGPVARFLVDDRGEYAMEFLMILTFGVLPLMAAAWLLRDILVEYVAFGQIFVSSPFF